MTIQYLTAHLQNQMTKIVSLPGLHKYNTPKGFRHFLETGRFLELPSSIYSPLELPDRTLLIRRMIAHSKGRKNSLRLIKGSLSESPLSLHIYVRDTGGYIIVGGRKTEQIFLTIQNPALLNAFRDFFGSLSEKDLYTQEETIQILEEMMAE